MGFVHCSGPFWQTDVKIGTFIQTQVNRFYYHFFFEEASQKRYYGGFLGIRYCLDLLEKVSKGYLLPRLKVLVDLSLN
jgi:hypothetical protein